MKTLFIIVLLCSADLVRSQVVSSWNFNSNPTDSLVSTGSLLPDKGNWKLSFLGNISSAFVSASSGGSSSDTTGFDDSALHTSVYPNQSEANQSAGLLLSGWLATCSAVYLRYDMRATATASRFYSVSYSVDSGMNWSTPIIQEFQEEAGTWQKTITVNLTGLQVSEDSLFCQIRLVSSFLPDSGRYRAVGISSAYSSTGTVRFDCVVLGATLLIKDVLPPSVLAANTIDDHSIELLFSEPVENLSATNPDNYAGMGLEFLVNKTGSSTVQLTSLNPFKQGVHHTLTITGISDTLGNVMKSIETVDVFRNDAQPNIRITEIMYNNPGPDEYEYLELYNSTNDTVYLEAFSMTGVQYTFSKNDFLIPGGYFLLAKDSGRCTQFFNRTFNEWDSGTLSNTGECLAVLNQKGDTLAQVNFDNTGGWPKEPNGAGSSLEFYSLTGNPDDPKNWRSCFYYLRNLDSLPIFGTPGFGYAENQVSFKTDTIWVQEGERPLIKLLMKKVDQNGLCARIAHVPETSASLGDFELTDPSFCTDSVAFFWSGIKILKDTVIEADEGLHFRIEAVENGYGKGYKDLVVIILGEQNYTGFSGDYPEREFRVFPNPASFYLNLPVSKWVYEMIDSRGQIVAYFRETGRVDVTPFLPGIYWLRCLENGFGSRLEIVRR